MVKRFQENSITFFCKYNPRWYTAVFHLEWPTRCEYIRVPTTGSLMGTRWKEAPLDNSMQQHAVGTQMCPHLVGHWVQGICCARAYMHAVSNQMRVRIVAQRYLTCSLIADVRTLSSCRNTHLMDNWLQYFQVRFLGEVLTFYDSVKPRQIASFADEKIDCACCGGALSCFYQSAFSHILNQINR